MAAAAEPRPSQAARRQRVLVSALDLAADGGHEAVQMRDVATSAGVALGTIYRYFPRRTPPSPRRWSSGWRTSSPG